jgi:hypothetical protein
MKKKIHPSCPTLRGIALKVIAVLKKSTNLGLIKLPLGECRHV